MKQLFRALVVAVLLAAVGPVGALGLGKLEKSSSLNERFNGRIPLVSVSADEISTLKVGLADESAFERADVVFSPVLRDLKFELVEPKTGQDYIQITSNKPIREPFLNFLVELNWASGRIFREYTVLLDPPLYDSQQQQASSASAPAQDSPQESSTASVSQEGHQVNYPDDRASRQRAAPPSSAYSGGDYGPARSGDTLWSIADEMKPAGVTTHQMMLALLRANPDAFIGNNINGLRRGAVLQMPEQRQMNAMSQSEALAQVKKQHGLWDDARQAMAAEPGQRADSATAAPAAEATAGTGEAGGESGSRLELVGTEEGATGQTGDAEGSGQTAEKLAIANENLESLRQENAELKDRLAQNEDLIEDLKRLIALKNDELASLQGRTAEESAGTASAPAGMVDMVEGVNYPNGDPSQFMNETASDDELLPGPVPPEEPVSHTVNRPGGAEAPATTADTSGDKAAGQAGEGEKAADEPAQSTASEPAQPAQQPAADGGMVDTLMGYVATARTFLLNNLMIVGAVLLAIIVLLAGSTYMRRRQARIEEEADAAIASGTFPDFNVGAAADQTSFDNDAESATELDAATATAADDDATEIMTDSAAEASDDDDLFVVPQGEQGPQQSADENDEDPLAEVNVLMAYEHFDQAESFVRNALKSDPNNVEYQAKLLEVFYAAGNKKKYEEAASDLRDMTGGKGEHWAMAVAMWQEMSPNRALFEGGGDEEDEQAVDSTGGGGIVDITGDTAGGGSEQQTSDTGGGLDFDLGDSTGGGSAATGDDSNEMLDITASEEASGNDDMLDLTAAESSSEDDDMLDMTAATSQVDDDDTMLDMTAAGSLEAAKSKEQSDSDSGDDGFEFSLGDDDQNDNDLLDVTQSGSVESDEDLLDVTSSGQSSQSRTDEDDNSLDFSLDMDSGNDDELDSEAMTAPGTTPATADDDASSIDELEAEFDLDSGESGSTSDELATSSDDSDNAFDFDLDIGDSDSAGDEQAASGSDTSKSDTDDSFDMDLEIQDDADSNDLDEIGEELDRLEQTLGTLSRREDQDATKGLGSNTSDALDGIDSALEDMDSESDTVTAADSSDTGNTDDGGIELSLDEETADDDKAGSADELDLSLDDVQSDDNDDFSDFDLGTDSTQESGTGNDDTSSVGLKSSDDDDFSDFDLDIGDDDNASEGGEGEDDTVSLSLDSGDDDLTSELSGFDFDLDSDDDSGDPSSGSETGDNDLSAELSEISKELESGDLDSATEDANDAGGLSMDFDLDTGEASDSGGDLEVELDNNAAADGSSDDTQQVNVSDDSGDETDFSSELDLDLSTDDMSANKDTNESIDMDSTVELPKDKLSGGLSLKDDEYESDGNDDEDSTLFVGRSSDTEEQSLEDELTTKLDLAKAYVELGDADSARGILQEVMTDGNDDQKRQAGEMLGQL